MMHVVNTPKSFSREEILNAVEEVRSGVSPHIVAKQMNIAQKTLEDWMRIHEESKNQDLYKKKSVFLSDDKKIEVYHVFMESQKSGRPLSFEALGKRFDVSGATISNIIKREAERAKLYEKRAGATAAPPPAPPKPEPEALNYDKTVSLRGDYLEISFKIHKKDIASFILNSL